LEEIKGRRRNEGKRWQLKPFESSTLYALNHFQSPFNRLLPTLRAVMGPLLFYNYAIICGEMRLFKIMFVFCLALGLLQTIAFAEGVDGTIPGLEDKLRKEPELGKIYDLIMYFNVIGTNSISYPLDSKGIAYDWMYRQEEVGRMTTRIYRYQSSPGKPFEIEVAPNHLNITPKLAQIKYKVEENNKVYTANEFKVMNIITGEVRGDGIGKAFYVAGHFHIMAVSSKGELLDKETGEKPFLSGRMVGIDPLLTFKTREILFSEALQHAVPYNPYVTTTESSVFCFGAGDKPIPVEKTLEGIISFKIVPTSEAMKPPPEEPLLPLVPLNVKEKNVPPLEPLIKEENMLLPLEPLIKKKEK
jgi:hypothetical protein